MPIANINGVDVEVDQSYVDAAKPGDEFFDYVNRSYRNSLLAETDWWANSDITMTQAQREYRQALRDITTHPKWPNVMPDDWPIKPE